MRSNQGQTTSTVRVCIVAADAGRARFFEALRANGGLREYDTLVNPEARAPERQLASDRPGRMANSAGRGGHSFGEHAKPHHEARENFARLVAKRMRVARTENNYDRFYLIAEPEVLGMIRNHLDAVTRKRIAGEVDKSLAKRSDKTIRAALPVRL